MRRSAAPAALVLGLAAFAAATVGQAQQREVYRYTDPDGRVVYADRPPLGDAKNVQAKRLGANFIESDQTPIATRQASERYPVTLYNFGCGEICTNAEALLNRRGVPFSTINVEEPQGAQRLQQLTGEANAPVLQVGDKLIAKGFNEARWQALLDEAGYPKTAAPRRTPLRNDAEAAPATDARATTAAAPKADGGYPR